MAKETHVRNRRTSALFGRRRTRAALLVAGAAAGTVALHGRSARGVTLNQVNLTATQTSSSNFNTSGAWSDSTTDVPGTNAAYTVNNASNPLYNTTVTASQNLYNVGSYTLYTPAIANGNGTYSNTFYGGGLQVSGGTIVFNASSAGTSYINYNFPNLSGGILVTNATLSFVSTNTTYDILNAGLALAGTNTISDTTSAYSQYEILNGAASGSGTVTFSFPGAASGRTVTFNGSGSTYTGAVVLGTIVRGNASYSYTNGSTGTFSLNRSMGSVSSYTVGTNWTFVDNGVNLVNGAAMALTGNVTLPTAATTDTFGIITGAGNITAAGTTALVLKGASAGGTYSGVLAGSGLSLNMSGGSNTQTLSVANTYGGGTLVSAGRLAATVSGAFGSGSVNVSSGAGVYLSGGTLANTFILNGNSTYDTYGALRVDGGATVSGNVILAGNTQIGSYSGNGIISGVISDGGNGFGFAKTGGSGNGTITLTAANTYSGPTTVTAGTLAVANTAGSGTGTGDVTVSGGTFASGTVGTISGNLLAGPVLNNIAPGGIGAIGTLTVGGLTTGSNTDILFDLGNASSGTVSTNGDLFNIGSGTVSIAANTILSFNTSTAANGVDYRLFGGAGAANLNLANFILPTVNGDTFTLLPTTNNVDPGYVDLAVTIQSARNLTWDNGSGTGLWNTTDANFNNGAGDVAFSSAAMDNVTFNDANNGNYNVSIPGVVTPGSTTVTTAGTYTFNGSGGIGGTGGLTVNGTGTLVLGTSNSFTGGATLSSGTLDLANANALAVSTLAYTGGTLTFDASVTGRAFTLAGLTGSGNIVLQNNAATPAAIALSVGSNNASTGYSGSLSGPGSLVKVGAGTLTLTGSNSYAGQTNVSGGTLVIGSTAALPTSPLAFVGTGTLNLSGAGGAATVPQITIGPGATATIVNGPIALAPAGTVTFTAATAGTSTLSIPGSSLSFAGGATIDATAANTSGATGIVVNVPALITGTGGLTIKSFGNTADNGNGNSSVFNMSNAANSFTGGVAIATGLVDVDDGDGIFGNAANAGTNAITIAAGAGLLATKPVTLSTNSIVLSGSGTHYVRDYGAATLTLNGVISDGGAGAALRFIDSGTAVLAGANTYTGATTINDGALIVTGNESAATGGYTIGSGSAYTTTVAFNAGSSIVVAAGQAINIGTLPGGTSISSANQTLNVSTGVNNAGALAVGRSGYLNVNGGATWNQSGPMNVQPVNASGYSAYVTVNAGGVFNYSGSTPINLTPSIANGGASYLAIAGGTFITGQPFSNAAPAGAPPTVAGASNGSSSIALTSGGAITLSANVPVLTTTAGGTSIFAVGNLSGGAINTNGFNTALTTPITNASTLGVLTKTGAGTLALSGTSTYTGGTILTGGTLQASSTTNSLGTGTTAVNGGVLAGTGATGGPVVVNAGGTITAGSGATAADSIGTLTSGLQTWNASGAFTAKATSDGTTTSSDLLQMSGLTISTTGVFQVTVLAKTGSAAIPAGTQLTLAQDTNTGQTNVFTNAITAGNLTLSASSTVTYSDGSTPSLSEVDSGGGEFLVLTTASAPEPTSLLLAGLAAAPLALGRRRRRSTAA